MGHPEPGTLTCSTGNLTLDRRTSKSQLYSVRSPCPRSLRLTGSQNRASPLFGFAPQIQGRDLDRSATSGSGPGRSAELHVTPRPRVRVMCIPGFLDRNQSRNLQTDLPRPPIRSRPDQNLQSYLGRTAKANLPKPPSPTKIRRPAKNQALAELADLPVPALPEICPVLGFFGRDLVWIWNDLGNGSAERSGLRPALALGRLAAF